MCAITSFEGFAFLSLHHYASDCEKKYGMVEIEIYGDWQHESFCVGQGQKPTARDWI